MKNMSIKSKLLLIIIFTIVVVASIIAIKSIYSLNEITHENIARYKKNAYKQQEETLKSFVEIAKKILEHYYARIASENKNEDEMKAEALKEISELRYGKSGYFFVYDYQGTVLALGVKPSLVGKNLINLKSKNGVYQIKELIAAAKRGGGLVIFDYEKPNDTKSYDKFGYAMAFEKWNWMIGTGAYADEIDAEIAKIRTNANKQIKSIVIEIVSISLVVSILIALFVLFFINSQITKPLMTFHTGLMDFFKYLNKEKATVEKIDLDTNDEIGQMAIAVNNNIEKTNRLLEQDHRLIENVKNIVLEVNSGNLNNRLETITENESLEELKSNLNKMLDSISYKINNNLGDMELALEEFRHMNFSYRIKNPTGEVAKALNNLADIINEMLVNNKKNGLNLTSNSKNLLETVSILSTASNTSAASLEETAAALEEITSNVISNSENISKMVKFANNLKNTASEGESNASRTTVAMDNINEQVISINEAITVIDQIAFQTNILSLNAAVEAATAGEAGKGFAVVAQEVRNLASRSAEAAKEIKSLVEHATVKANEGKSISSEMIQGYSQLKNSIDETLSLIHDVEASSKEQRTGIEQINDTVTELDQQTQKNASVASQTNAIAVETQKIASEILDEVDKKNFIGKDDIQ
ncbi:methyl-accepting chemotaxis sensory transducer [Arcobacter nitrofigilis DSM 7299]|uniref:Methyl-accepting chemotaxis sensory transducer n=1 Tax=Arcobacter nitrofigilis (strain ATCC 33309 / DSM 7299 / CCUG 15893 / LMG 7604 / NCTC 12251 / CI) TaxID=572480 RepID=D5V1B7_ARCNC|nr:cache domain-containing protein [Arcobacter nitrofigilis]ADG94079.1 methyl-accepting chemotaxis sensory transducer [Arcobacter nitrofigilis DSM 7299]